MCVYTFFILAYLYTYIRIYLHANVQGFTGGLGKRMVKRADKEYGVWACVRDWNEMEQIACGARHHELACFWYEEKHRTFDFKGLNHETRLVTAAQYEHGMYIHIYAYIVCINMCIYIYMYIHTYLL